MKKILLLTFVLVLSGCGLRPLPPHETNLEALKNKTNTEIEESHNVSEISEEEAIRIVQDKYHKTPVKTTTTSFNGRNYIGAVLNRKQEYVVHNLDLVVLQSFAGSWREILRREDDKDGFFENLSLEAIGGNLFIFFELKHLGRSMGDISFILLSIKDSKEYSIVYNWGITDIERIIVSEETESETGIRDYLEKKLKNSDIVQKIDGILSSEEEWQVKNEIVYDNLENTLFFEDSIITLVPIDSEKWKKIENNYEGIENSNYKVITALKGPTFVQNKKSGETAILWVPKSAYESLSTMKFQDENTVIFYEVMYDYDKLLYIVNLEDNSIRKAD